MPMALMSARWPAALSITLTQERCDAAPLQVRYETAVMGYQKRQDQFRKSLGDLDYYVMNDAGDQRLSRPHVRQQQRHRRQYWLSLARNWKRVYLRYRETDNELAGRVTKEQSSITHALPIRAYVSGDYTRPQPGSTWLGNKTTLYLDVMISQLEVGLGYHDYPMDLHEGPNWLKVASHPMSAAP